MSTTSLSHNTNKFTPAYQPISDRTPTELDNRTDALFFQTMPPLETEAQLAHKDGVVAALRSVCVEWVQHVAVHVCRIFPDEAARATGELFVFGSHRLGVRDPNSDIDAAFAAPHFCTLRHFFTLFKDRLRMHLITEIVAVEEAVVPVLSFVFDGVHIDLTFVRMAHNFPLFAPTFLLDDDAIEGLDDHAARALNGPRTTEMILHLMGGHPAFLPALRAVRRWAKARGLYGNKMGYFGGINCAILVGFICQLYPRATPAMILVRFFKHYSDWKWPEPVVLNNIARPDEAVARLKCLRPPAVWCPVRCSKDLMPIITPAYPAMNSALSVTPHSFEVICREIQRGFEIIVQGKKNTDVIDWARLFEPSDFFERYTHYVECRITDGANSRNWTGFVESRLRRLLQYPYLETLPLQGGVQLYTTATRKKDVCYYFIGFDLPSESTETTASIDAILARFRGSLMNSAIGGFRGDCVPGMDFFAKRAALP